MHVFNDFSDVKFGEEIRLSGLEVKEEFGVLRTALILYIIENYLRRNLSHICLINMKLQPEDF